MDMTALPNNVQTLKQQVIAQQGEITLLLEKVRLLKDQLFGRKSERLEELNALGQLNLFGDGEDLDHPAPSPKTRVNSHNRKKPRRTPIPEEYPRIDVVHDIDEQDKICHCGCRKSMINEDISEELDITPAKIHVIRHRRPKWACRGCENVDQIGPTVAIAPLPPKILPRCLASYGLLAYIVVSKYVDAMPLYRQEQYFRRHHLEISRKTMSDWIVKLGVKLDAVWRLLLEEIRGAPWIGMDETRIRVHKEKGRSNKSTSYMWVMQCRQPNPVVLFHYHPSRGAQVPKELLEGYQGVVVSDEWYAYKHLEKLVSDNIRMIIHALCWVHVRRYFVDVVKGLGDTVLNPKSITAQALKAIQQLYALEARADDEGYSLDQRHRMRQTETRPLLEELKRKLDKVLLESTPTGNLAKAIKYTVRNWKELNVFLDHPLVDPDNNWAENFIRPFVIGRKNWLFAGSPAGAKASATLYSLAITAKANGVNEYEYFRHLFKNLPLAKTEAEIKALLPTTYKQSN